MNNHKHNFYIDSELNENGEEVVYRYCVCGEKLEVDRRIRKLEKQHKV